MPDSFFQSDKKRKRPSRHGNAAGPSKQPYEKPYRPAPYGKGHKPKGRARASQRDEDLSSDAEGERGGLDLDSMDFRKGRNDMEMSDDEVIDENETAAEKRVRLAKGYLAKVRGEIAAAQEDDAYDAAEIDRELIASRLQLDVVCPFGL
jgi:ribosomal RNA-processing protein 9